MFVTSLTKLQFGYEQTLSCHAAHLSTVATNTSLAMSTLCPGMLWQYIQLWEKTKMAEGPKIPEQHACVALRSNIPTLFLTTATTATSMHTPTDNYLCLLGLEDLRVVQVAWALAVRPQTGHCWPC